MAIPSESRLKNFVGSFLDLREVPWAFWCVIGAFVVESMAYFGILTLMTTFLSTDLRWSDTHAGWVVAAFTMLVTLFMLGVGSFAEAYGLRRAILFALAISTLGRGLYSLAAWTQVPGWAVGSVLGSVLIVAAGSGILQPVCYSGVKQYTTERTSSMGYGLIYAIMNFGIFLIGAGSSWIRTTVQDLKDGAEGKSHVGEGLLAPLAAVTGSGVQAVNWVCTGITALTFVLFLLLMTRRAEAAKLRPEELLRPAGGPAVPWGARMKAYLVDGPFGNPRFVFFIFMLLPVRTLFAHQWLTMPSYILRAYPEGVADRMEWLVNWINPLVIFFGVPVVTALTRRVNVYKMMVLGSLVSAVPTFLLCWGPDLTRLILYFVLFSIGEALWSARFLEYASELAPPGRVSQYMGLAQVPWLLAKGTTGLYSGLMLARFCPLHIPSAAMQTGTMWCIYGGIAMLSPIGLWLARDWVMVGLHSKAKQG